MLRTRKLLLSYSFLHEGILRGSLSKLGRQAPEDAAIYWKYGCWFYEAKKTRSQVLIESQWDDAESEAGAGEIRFRAWGDRADDLIEGATCGRYRRCRSVSRPR